MSTSGTNRLLARKTGAAIAVVLTLATLSGCRWWDERSIKDEVRATRQASNGTLQRKRAIVMSEEGLKALDRVDVAIRLNRADLAYLDSAVLHVLRTDKRLKDAHIRISSAAFDFGDQEIRLAVDLSTTVEHANISARVAGAGLLGAVESGIVFNVVARQIELTDLSLTADNERTSAVATAINKALDAALGAVNAALDVGINRDPRKAVVLWLDQSVLDWDPASGNTASTRFTGDRVRTVLVTKGAAFLAQKDQVLLLAKTEFENRSDLPARELQLPPLGALLEIEEQDADQRVKAYQAAVVDRFANAFGKDVVQGSDTLLAVTRSALARATNTALSRAHLRADLLVNEPGKPESTDLTVHIEKKDCQAIIQGCQFKDVCADRSVCQTTTVQQVEDVACKAACITVPNVGLFGRNPRRECENACGTIGKTIVTPIHNATCDGFIAWDNATGHVGCNAASNIDKSACDIEKNVGKSLCDIQQDVGRFYEHNPFATVQSQVSPDARISLGLAEATVSDDLSSLQTSISASGSGKVAVQLKYVRHTPTDILIPGLGYGLCVADWKESATLDVSATAATHAIKFAGSFEKPEQRDQLQLVYRQEGEEVAFLDFDPSPMQALFGDKPQLVLNCPAALFGTALLATGEALFTKENARQYMPLFSGRNYPMKVKNVELRLALPAIPLCESRGRCKDGAPLVLAAEASGNAVIYKSKSASSTTPVAQASSAAQSGAVSADNKTFNKTIGPASPLEQPHVTDPADPSKQDNRVLKPDDSAVSQKPSRIDVGAAERAARQQGAVQR